ncbi:MAG TPA: hypothetical protein VHM30_04150 [Gemmatimonadaceae bacterium]|nr:hypothetical protein [Gemmatimonadaceae bacterium]
MLAVGIALLAVVVAVFTVIAMRRPAAMPRAQFLAKMDEFIAGKHTAADWEAFCEEPVRDADLRAAQRALAYIDAQYPPEQRGTLCGPDGMALIRRYRDELRRA